VTRRCAILNTIADPEASERLVAPHDKNKALPIDTHPNPNDNVLRGRRQTLFENRPEGS
jgi:protocatechuate 3,4-dioxygenase beta subunit